MGGGVFAASAALGFLHSDYAWDGAWVLQVIARMHAGDVLYRDVFAGVPPLTFAIGYVATAIAGVELAALKLLVAGTMAISWVAGARLLGRLTNTSHFDGPLAIAMVACAQPEVAALYQPLANMFLLLTIDAASAAADDPERGGRRLWIAGLWCGLAFLSKQTIGVYGGIAAVIVLAGSRRTASLRPIAVVGIAAVLVSALGLAPIVMTGGWTRFVDYAFLGKGTYVSVAGVPYLEELRAFGLSIVSGTRGSAVYFAKNLALIVPVVAAIGVVILFMRRRSHRPIFVAGMAIGLTEFVGLFPRADVAHVIPVVPGLLVVALLAWHVVTTERARPLASLRAIATVVIAADVAIRFAAAGAALASPDREISHLPHFRGLVMPRAHIDKAGKEAARLHDAAAGAPLFLLVPNAGFYYLTSGVTNPTPFDYPLKSAFGRTGMPDTIARFERGELQQLCVKRAAGVMAPDVLQDYVEARMTAADDLGVCVLYKRR